MRETAAVASKVLEATLSADYTPGTNRSGDLACADWRFLLPSLSLDVVVCIGMPRESTVKVLSTMANVIHVIAQDKIDAPECLQSMARVCIHEDEAFPIDRNRVSLILIAREISRVLPPNGADWRSRLSRFLGPDTSVYLESHGVPALSGARSKLVASICTHIGGREKTYWLTKQAGELRTAVPLGEPRIANYFFENVLYGVSYKSRLLSKAGRLLSKVRLIDQVAPSRGTLIQTDKTLPDAGRVPDFLCRLAAESEVDLEKYRFGLSARGKYNSNKNIYFLFEPGAKTPEIIVKMTRVTRFNDRLEHEYETLSTVKRLELVPKATYPDALFFGYHQGLAVLAQKAVSGRPFRTVTTSTIDCPAAADAVDWLTTLGRNSANSSSAPPHTASEQLQKLFETFCSIYTLSEAHSTFMHEQIRSVGDSASAFPIVFNHGDAGSWNVLVDEDGRSIFLDWEAADPNGMPLWDLFYFLRSFCNWISRERQGSSDALVNFRDNFLSAGPLNAMVVEYADRYCDALALDKRMIMPMFYTTWMHRALRQATWADTLDDAHFVSLLRMCIDHVDSPGLRKLFQGD